MQIPLSVWITWMPSKIKAVLDIPDFLSTSNTAPSCVLSLFQQFARIVFVRCFLPHTLLPEVLLPLLNQNYAYYYSFPLKKAGQPTELSWRTFCHSLFLCPVYLLLKIPASPLSLQIPVQRLQVIRLHLASAIHQRRWLSFCLKSVLPYLTESLLIDESLQLQPDPFSEYRMLVFF